MACHLHSPPRFSKVPFALRFSFSSSQSQQFSDESILGMRTSYCQAICFQKMLQKLGGFCVVLFGAGDRTQGPVLARQAQYY